MNSGGKSAHAAPGGRPARWLLQAVGEILEIDQALAQIRIGSLHHAAFVVSSRTFCTAASAVRPLRIASAIRADPAAIGGEHAVGFENIAVLADAEPAMRRRPVRRSLRASPRPHGVGVRARPSTSSATNWRISSLGSCSTAGPIASPGLSRMPSSRTGSIAAGLALRYFERVDEFAAGDKLGDDHRDRLQYLDLVLVIMAQRAVLHDQNAQHAAAAQDRHAHQRMIDLFAGFRP